MIGLKAKELNSGRPNVKVTRDLVWKLQNFACSVTKLLTK